jgi:hypothetical protein
MSGSGKPLMMDLDRVLVLFCPLESPSNLRHSAPDVSQIRFDHSQFTSQIKLLMIEVKKSCFLLHRKVMNLNLVDFYLFDAIVMQTSARLSLCLQVLPSSQ